jgi:hypothetical protein
LTYTTGDNAMHGSSPKGETRWRRIGDVQLYARRDSDGRPILADAIDENEDLIRKAADLLQNAGYGVLREQVPRAGRVYYRLRARWAGPGEPPEDPLASVQLGN